MTVNPQHTAVIALHWQVNVIKPEGFFGDLLAKPVAHSGVIDTTLRFHQALQDAGIPLFFTRFTIPEGEGQLTRNTPFMHMVSQAQDAFRPESAGSQLIPEMAALASENTVIDNQKLSGLAGNELPQLLRTRGIDTLLLTGVATNLTVEQTARHATDLGFTVHVISDTVTAANEEIHAASLANLELTTAGCLTADQALA